MGHIKNYMNIILWTFVSCCIGDRVKLSFACPISCSCFSGNGSLFTTVKCNFDLVDQENDSSLFPFVLPINSNIVELQNVAGEDFFSRMSFEDSYWSKVLELTINASDGRTDVLNNSLHGLDNLKVLRMHVFVGSLESGVFLHTPDIATLDLSDNPHLYFKDISWALRNAMPKLKYLDISRIQLRKDEPLLLGSDFSESIRTKNLEVLNVSNTKLISFDSSYVYSSIQALNLTRTSLDWMQILFRYEWFPNIRELDISYSSLPAFFQPSLPFSYHKQWRCLKFLRSLRYFYAHDIVFSQFPLRIIDGYLNIACGYMLVEFIDISNSNIRWLNVSTNVIFLYLKTFIVSQNSLEYISPKLFKSFPNMSILRIERNNLSAMQHFPDFEELFSNNEVLETLDVSWNSLSFLPRKLFVSLRKLKELNLQGNRIVHFDVDVRNLFNLKALDLSENGPILISTAVTRDLDSVNSGTLHISISINASSTTYSYSLNATYTTTAPLYRDLVVNLQGNKFDCSCEHISFLSWLTESKIYFEGRTTYKCGQEFYSKEIDKDNIQSLENYCNLQMKLPFIIVPSIIGCFFILCIVLIRQYKRRRGKLYKKRRQYVNGYVQSDNEMVALKEKRYPAFLSFCSDDNNIAKEYFCPTITRALQTHFGEKEVLAMGESIFKPGKLIFSEIEECFSRSDVIIFLVTLDFIESDWCRFELNQADLQRKPTIYLVENTVLKRKLPSCLRKIKTHTRATWTRVENDIEITPDWDVIAGQVLDFAAASKRDDGHISI